MHRVDGQFTDNGFLLNSSHCHDQSSITKPQSMPSDAKTVSLSGSFGAASAPQEYGNYAPNHYNYGGTIYQGFYSSYQEQPNSTYSQPQPNHSFSHSLGPYQNTGAPYQPLSSFQNIGSLDGTTSYTSTYCNPGDYQISGGYPSNGYHNQTPLWHDGSYVNYTSNQNSNYNSANGIVSAPSINYEHSYRQWADYYSQTEVICAPGTEHLPVAGSGSYGSSATAVSCGYPIANKHPPSSVLSWRPEPFSSEIPLQSNLTSIGSQDGYVKPNASCFPDLHANPMQPDFKKHVDVQCSFDAGLDQMITQQGSGTQHPIYQVTQVLPSPHPSAAAVSDPRRVSILQIPMNPKIASNLDLALSKNIKDGSAASSEAKPAYISVALQKPDNKLLSSVAADTTRKPGVLPKSLRGYVERAFNRCKDDSELMAASQATIKEIITKAVTDGTLEIRDWDSEPLFPLPNPNFICMEDPPCSTTISPVMKCPKTPVRRSKSRWEPLSEEKLDKTVSADGSVTRADGGDRKVLSGNSESEEDALRVKFSMPERKTCSKTNKRAVKKQRASDRLYAIDNSVVSSDSEKEQSLTAHCASEMEPGNSLEERRRRESRSKRFQKGLESKAGINYLKQTNAGSECLYSRRASALILSKRVDDDGGSMAVEDIDWDALTVKGTCQEIEKRYLRLTSAPDPCSVRPEEVLEKALVLIQNSSKNYLYKCDQLKSIRQDLTVQRVRNQLTLRVYETHARLALEAGDMPEYNQCQSQLKSLYADGIEGCYLEFAAYSLLCVILHSHNKRELLSLMTRLKSKARNDKALKHALEVRAAVASGNYVKFFRLYRNAPNLNGCLMDPCLEKMRYNAINCICRSYRPTVPVSYVAHILGFCDTEGIGRHDSDGLEECMEWLKAHGACLIANDSEEKQLDTKASSSSLLMPEPDDAVAHGDASLAVNDFLTRTNLQ